MANVSSSQSTCDVPIYHYFSDERGTVVYNAFLRRVREDGPRA